MRRAVATDLRDQLRAALAPTDPLASINLRFDGPKGYAIIMTTSHGAGHFRTRELVTAKEAEAALRELGTISSSQKKTRGMRA